mmetsp:Transcript_32089/g.44754  ORF Transcript_32089/g.44754 Transcript_32089/m.44754 type:complete len:251 (-) Transcript_32089:211-963(-)
MRNVYIKLRICLASMQRPKQQLSRRNVDMCLFSNAMTITAKITNVNNVYSSPNKSVSLEKHSGPTASNCKERTLNHENTAANADEVAPAVLTVKVNNCSNKMLQIAKSFASHLINSFFSSLLLPTITGLAITHVYAIAKSNAAIPTRIATVYAAPELSGHLTHSPSCSKKPSAHEAHKVSVYPFPQRACEFGISHPRHLTVGGAGHLITLPSLSLEVQYPSAGHMRKPPGQKAFGSQRTQLSPAPKAQFD